MKQTRHGTPAIPSEPAGQHAARAIAWTIAAAALTIGMSGEPVARTAVEMGPAALREQPVTQYRAFRRMHARNEKTNHEGWLDAWTEMEGRTFRFDVVSERGSEYIRNKVLRNMLQREQEIVTAGGASRSDLTTENYDIKEPEHASSGEPYLILKPKRKDLLLVDGRAVLNAEGTELRRVEGRLSKNPSFWTSRVMVVRHYAKIDGIRVPVSTETVAKMKLIGTAQLEVFYEYESINGKPLSVAARMQAAAYTGR